MSWFDSLPPVDTTVPCGAGTHTVRWQEGGLTLTAHPDAEAELVLGALGGDKPGCVTLAETWARHAGDLTILTSGPRCDADRVSVDWSQVEELRGQLPAGWAQLISGARPSPPTATSPASPGSVWRMRQGPAKRVVWPGSGMDDIIRRQLQQIELLELLALGPQFQFRLADTVTVTPHEGPGWGSLRVTGTGRDRRLRASLPVGWLAEVWACGLSVVGGHLVVAVEEPGYPVACVLGISSPDAEPVRLRAHATDSPGHPSGRGTTASRPGSAGGLVAWTL